MIGYGKATNAAQGINFYYNTNLVVKGNEFAGGPDPGASYCLSDNVIEVHTSNHVLFEYNDIHDAYQQAGIAIKEPNPASQNVIFRFNKVHDNSLLTRYTDGESFGVATTASTHNIYIYGNYIAHNGNFGLGIQRGANYTYAWSNVIINNGWDGVWTWTDGGVYGTCDNSYIFNNTIANNEGDKSQVNRSGISFTESSGINHVAKNNILYNNRTGQSPYHQIYVASGVGSGTTLDYNTLWNTDQTPSWYWRDGYKTLAQMQALGQGAHSTIQDPGFTNPGAGDYTLDGTHINDGKDLSQCFDVPVQGQNYHICINDALDPNATNWKATPPIVRTVKQGANGAWDRGAYAYGTGTGSPDINAPIGLKIIVGGN